VQKVTLDDRGVTICHPDQRILPQSHDYSLAWFHRYGGLRLESLPDWLAARFARIYIDAGVLVESENLSQNLRPILTPECKFQRPLSCLDYKNEC
jgi:hypothetical protein